MNRQNSATCQYAIPSLNISPGWSIYFLTSRLLYMFLSICLSMIRHSVAKIKWNVYIFTKLLCFFVFRLSVCPLAWSLQPHVYQYFYLSAVRLSVCLPAVCLYNACTLYSLCPLILMNLNLLVFSVFCSTFCLYVNLFVCFPFVYVLYVWLCMYPSLCVPFCLSSVCPHAYEPCLSSSWFCDSDCLSIRLCSCLFVWMPVWIFHYMSVCLLVLKILSTLSTCCICHIFTKPPSSSVCLYVCLSVCLFQAVCFSRLEGYKSCQ